MKRLVFVARWNWTSIPLSVWNQMTLGSVLVIFIVLYYQTVEIRTLNDVLVIFSCMWHVDWCTTLFSCHFHLLSYEITVFTILQCIMYLLIHIAHRCCVLWIKWPQIWVNYLSIILLSLEIWSNFCRKCAIREWISVRWCMMQQAPLISNRCFWNCMNCCGGTPSTLTIFITEFNSNQFYALT